MIATIVRIKQLLIVASKSILFQSWHFLAHIVAIKLELALITFIKSSLTKFQYQLVNILRTGHEKLGWGLSLLGDLDYQIHTFRKMVHWLIYLPYHKSHNSMW